MPSSGARSGTKPGRGNRLPPPVDPVDVELRCGHRSEGEPVIVFPRRLRRYWCEACRTLVAPR